MPNIGSIQNMNKKRSFGETMRQAMENTKEFYENLKKTQIDRSFNLFDDSDIFQTGKQDLNTRVDAIEKRLDKLEGNKSSFIIIPTPSEIQKFS